jgi:hypothetical protein
MVRRSETTSRNVRSSRRMSRLLYAMLKLSRASESNFSRARYAS